MERVEDPRLLTRRRRPMSRTSPSPVPRCSLTYVRSPVAHARITAIDAPRRGRARCSRRGHRRRPDRAGPCADDMPVFPEAMRRPFLARDIVRFVGEPVAAIVAETTAQRRRRRRAGRRRLRPAARARRPGGRARRRGRCCSPTRAPTSCCDRHRGHPGRLLRTARSWCAERIVNQRIGGGSDRGPGRRGLLDRRRPPRPSLGVPGRPPGPRGAGRRLRAGAVPGPGGRPRRRRRLRRQGPPLPGGGCCSAGCARRVGPAGALDRDPHREHAGAGPRPGPDPPTSRSAAPATAGSPRYQLDVVQDAGAYPLHRRRAAEHDACG